MDTTHLKLYAVNKSGKVMVYVLDLVEPDDHNRPCVIKIETGLITGKLKQTLKRILKGKNLYKANATNAYTQALSELNSKYSEKLKEGYKSYNYLLRKYKEKFGDYGDEDFSEETSTNVIKLFKALNISYNTDHNDRLKPMLAEKIQKFEKSLTFPLFVQPKLNGIRCQAINEEGNIKLLSREGIELNIPHIANALKNKLEISTSQNIFSLDGEIYLHDVPLQDIVHLSRSPLLSTQLEYHVYDIISDKQQRDRLSILKGYIHNIASDCIKAVETQVAYSIEEVRDFFSEKRKEGFEGAMVRIPNAYYKPGFRDKCLLKVKGTLSDDFEIVGVNLKSGSATHDFVWVCKNAFGKKFEVRPHGTEEERASYYEIADLFFGHKLQLEFHEYTKDRIPFHITSVTIRDYES